MDVSYLRLSTIIFTGFFGVCLLILSRHLKVPAIAPLLIGGVLFGPEFLGLINTEVLGTGLKLIISICVAVILFEGGLTLDMNGYKKGQKVIWRLLTIGVTVTWIGSAAAIHLIMGTSIALSVLAGSLIIVTGPTVIGPLLQRIKVKQNLHQILHWEGVLIDPIGVFIAVLCFEWFSLPGSIMVYFGHFAMRIAVGIVLGTLGGFVLIKLLQKELVHVQQMNIFVLTSGIFIFGVADFIEHESGILAVIIAGFLLGWKKPPGIRYIRQFKSELTEMALSSLFLLLAANLDLNNFSSLGFAGVFLVCTILFIVRPLAVALSSLGTNLKWNEKLFLSWIAPRGIVAGSMASLFALQLNSQGHPEAKFLEAFTFAIIATTVIFQGLTAGFVAKVLKVQDLERKGWLIIGAHTFGRKIADFFKTNANSHCTLVDTNRQAVKEAIDEGYSAYSENILSKDVLPEEIISGIGNVLALTDNRDLNQLICEIWSDYVGKKNCYRWSPLHAERSTGGYGTGLCVWSDLPKPSHLSFDIRHGDVTLDVSPFTPDLAESNPGLKPLLLSDQNKPVFPPFQMGEFAQHPVLMMNQQSHQLPVYINAGHISWMESDQLEEVISSLLTLAHESHPEIPYEAVLNNILEREKLLPSIISNGVAVPHSHCENIKHPICMLGILPEGLKHAENQKVKTRLIFLLLSPEAQPQTHLLLLADIARIASSVKSIDRIVDADNGDEVKNFLIEMEHKKEDF